MGTACVLGFTFGYSEMKPEPENLFINYRVLTSNTFAIALNEFDYHLLSNVTRSLNILVDSFCSAVGKSTIPEVSFDSIIYQARSMILGSITQNLERNAATEHIVDALANSLTLSCTYSESNRCFNLVIDLLPFSVASDKLKRYSTLVASEDTLNILH